MSPYDGGPNQNLVVEMTHNTGQNIIVGYRSV